MDLPDLVKSFSLQISQFFIHDTLYVIKREMFFLQGVYVRQGCKVSNLKNIPKVFKFFYGAYKLRLQLIDKEKNVHGCVHILFDFLRPWEKPN